MSQLELLKSNPNMPLKDLPLWPAKVSIPPPSRALVILWGREVRHELFDSEEGRLLAERAFYDDGLTANYTQIGADLLPQYGEYLLYSERERDRKVVNPAAKREDKKRKLIAKQKQNAQEFEAALGRMGLDFESEAHVCI